MLYFVFIGVPFIGVLWFWNFIDLLQNLKKNESTHNQKLFGAMLTFVFIASCMYCLIGITS